MGEARWRRWLWPLRSRKVQVAIATVVVAYAAQAGLAISQETVATVLSVGVALIRMLIVESPS